MAKTILYSASLLGMEIVTIGVNEPEQAQYMLTFLSSLKVLPVTQTTLDIRYFAG